MPPTARFVCSSLFALFVVGCDEEPPAPAAPETPPLEATERPETATTRAFTIDPASSAVDFVMVAPLENIHGVARESMSGELYLDLANLSASRGLVRVDLDPLEIFQRKRASTAEELGEETKNDTQNEHARTWLQIAGDTPQDVRDANRYAQFNVVEVTNVSANDVLAMEGAERVVTLNATGDFRLHGRTTRKTARLELRFQFEGDAPRSVAIRTLEPVNVGLAEHEVHPRSAFDRLAEATLATLGEKVAEAAPITFELRATAGEAMEAAPELRLEESEAAAAAARLGMPEPTAAPTAEPAAAAAE
ncbi:MAG: YceI family protein [Myxococcota bacterium]|jgi:hypothetical protein|nr:YceI family protein [Myxococcota bacterium]